MCRLGMLCRRASFGFRRCRGLAANQSDARVKTSNRSGPLTVVWYSSVFHHERSNNDGGGDRDNCGVQWMQVEC